MPEFSLYLSVFFISPTNHAAERNADLHTRSAVLIKNLERFYYQKIPHSNKNPGINIKIQEKMICNLDVKWDYVLYE